MGREALKNSGDWAAKTVFPETAVIMVAASPCRKLRRLKSLYMGVFPFYL
jgi:hypothetical protein